MHRRQVVEVWTEVAAITDGDFQQARFRETDVLDPVEIQPQNSFQLVLLQRERIKFD